MAGEIKSDLHFEIGHVLFIDIVGYSQLLIDKQHDVVHDLNQIVRSTDQFRAAESAGELIRLPAGDGMALVFSRNMEAPVECALEISKQLRSHPELRVRMGIHSGPVRGWESKSAREAQTSRAARGANVFWEARKLIFAIGLTVTILALALFSLFRWASAGKLEKSIAVLPFENLSDDKENAYFAGGIQDDILTNLSKIGDLKVISRSSVMQLRGSPHNIREIGKMLGVAAVLEGSVRRSGSRIRVNVQLVNTANDEHIWAEDCDRELTDVIAIQTDLALQIASTLQTKLSPGENARLHERPTKNAEAYLTYLQAQDSVTRSQTHEDLEKIAMFYEKAIQLDPAFALAFARLSYIESALYLDTGDPSILDRARAAAKESLRLQPTLPEAHLALGYIHYRGDHNYDDALRELAIAKAGLPNDPDVFLVIGSIERRQGNWRQSTMDLEKAASVNPTDTSLWANLALNYRSIRNFPAAARALDRGITAKPGLLINQCLRARLEIDWHGDADSMERLLSQIPEGSDPGGEVTLARYQLKLYQRKYDEALDVLNKSPLDAFSDWRGGMPLPKSFLRAQASRFLNDTVKARTYFEEAAQIVESAVRTNPLDASRHAFLGQIYAGLGRTTDAIREGKRAVELLPESTDALDGPIMTLALAKIYTMVGELEPALDLLKHSIATPAGITVPLLKVDPVWDPLRSSSHFEKLLTSPAFVDLNS